MVDLLRRRREGGEEEEEEEKRKVATTTRKNGSERSAPADANDETRRTRPRALFDHQFYTDD